MEISYELKRNPFVEIGNVALSILKGYFLLYLILWPLCYYTFYDTNPVVIPRALAELVKNLLFIIPLFIYRKGIYGYFHPLIFPLLFHEIIRFIKEPLFLLEPFVLHDSQSLFNIALADMSLHELAWVYVEADLLIALSLISYYLGYFLLRKLKAPYLQFQQIRPTIPRLLILSLAGLFFAYLVIRSSGGFTQQILALGMGRFRYRMQLGGAHWIVLSGFLKISLYIWFTLRRNAIRNPVFIALFMVSLVTSFLLTGSRSGVFVQIIVLLAIWVLKTHRIPVMMIAISGFIGLISLGALGQIRESGWAGNKEVDYTILTETSVSEKIALSRASNEERPDGYIAVVGKSMDAVGPLYGRTYVAALLFFVPRAIWPTKPRGAGAYNGNLLFGDNTFSNVEFGGEGGGIPTGPVGEAFWNFHIPGVIIVYLLYGLFHRWLAETHRLNVGNKAWLPIYIVALMGITPVTKTFVSFLQSFILLLVSYVFLRVIKLPKLRIA